MRGLLLIVYLGVAACCSLANAAPASYAADPINNNSSIRIQLAKDAIQTEETLILFRNNANPGYDVKEDAKYMQGKGQVRLFSYADQMPLVFNIQPYPTTRSVTRLNVFTRTDGTYQLRLEQVVNLPKMFDVWLVDNLLKDSLDLRNNPAYSFNVSKTDTNTFGGNRFKIIVKRNNALANRLLYFDAVKANNNKEVQIKWKAENEENNTLYTAERSTDNGKTFTIIDSVLSSSKGDYALTDPSPAKGLSLYRLKQVDFTESVKYSANIKIDNSVIDLPTAKIIVNNAPNIYPNPVTNQVNVAMGDKLPVATYSIAITNTWGLKVKEATTTGPQWQGEVGDLKPGIYMVTITSNDKKIVGYNKFLKK